MTRARQLLYFVASPRDPDAAVRGRHPSPASAARASSMLDFVLDALGEDALKEGDVTLPGGERFRILFPPAFAPGRGEDRAEPHPPLPDRTPPESPLPFPGEKPSRPPLKTSVTALVRLLRDEASQTETPADKRAEFQRVPPERPRFLTEEKSLNGSERGTLIHRCLGVLDLKALRQGDLEGALERIGQRGLFSPRELSVLRSPDVLDRIAGFYRSSLGQRMLRSPRIQREWTFNLHLGNSLADYLQGVIDLCFLEDGQWVLCDYKTDRLGEDALLESYREQLGLYRMALEKITRLPVKETLLYSLHLGRAVPVPFGAEPLPPPPNP